MTESNAETATRLHHDLNQAGVKYLMATFVDMHGKPKAKTVPLSHIERMLNGSEMFTGAALDGVPQDISDEEVAAMPDPDSCEILPWQQEIAWFSSNLWCRGVPFEPGSRNILDRSLARAREMGLDCNLGIESEFYVLRSEPDGHAPVSIRDTLTKPCYDVAATWDNFEWLDELVDSMQQLGWGVYSFDHEDGNGQFEIDSDFANAKTMADRFVLMRLMVGEIAKRHGLMASWMPKPFVNRTGSGAHFNVSLADSSGVNLFVDSKDPRGLGLSQTGYQFIAGILRHLPAISAVTSPTVNSYKRMVKQGAMSGSTWAPVFMSYGNNNRTNALRIPKAANRFELRAADSACNPYLAAAMIVSAGIEGIAQQCDPGAPHEDNMYEKSDAELHDLGIQELPRTLSQALDAFEADPLSREVFGETMFASWLTYKRGEWAQYMNHVSDWERDRYLNFF